MKFSALGPLTVVSDGDLLPLRPAHRRLLASLLIEPGAVVPTGTLVDRMWGEAAPPRPHNALHVHLSMVRKLVPGVIHGDGTGYQVVLHGHGFDVDEFTSLVEGAVGRLDDGHCREAVALATRAGRLWRGVPFPELLDVDAARGERHRLVELMTGSQLTLARALTLQGRVSESIAVLKQMVSEHPLKESLWEELILAYYLAGRQADALWAFDEASKTLRDELGIEPGAGLRGLEDRVLVQDPVLVPTRLESIPHNLPDPESTFVGRGDDLASIGKILESNHLVTITGAPGVGKTRLAVETARQLLPSYPGGVWVIRLVGARTSAHVAASIAAAMSVAEAGESLSELYSLLAPRPALLILDNCEHVLDQIREFIGSRLYGSRLRVLATSRSRLDTEDEVVWPLSPLAVPEDPGLIWQSPTGRLLADRLAAQDPALDLGTLETEDLLRLCASTGGVPLVIELTASRISSAPSMSVPKHASVTDAVRMSLELLDNLERTAFHRASVFASAFTLEALNRVCMPRSGFEEATRTIGNLVRASLLSVERSPLGVRYRMLEPIKDAAGAGLVGRERRATNNRHADWFVDAALGRSTSNLSEFDKLVQTDIEIADHRQAMRHLLDTGRVDDVVEMAAGLAPFWYSRFLAWEGRGVLEGVASPQLDARSQVRLHEAAGFLAWAVHDYEEADRHYQALLEIGQKTGDRRTVADALYGRGVVHQKRRFLDGAAMLEEAAAIYESLPGCERQLGECLLFRGVEEASAGDVATARTLLESAIKLLNRVGLLRQVSKAERWLSYASLRSGDERSSRDHADRAERLARDLGDHVVLAGALIGQAYVEVAFGEPDLAARHLSEARELIPDHDEVDMSQVLLPVAALAARVGDERLAQGVLTTVDDVYQRYGWRPVAEWSLLSLEIGVSIDRDSSEQDIASEVSDFLRRLAPQR